MTVSQPKSATPYPSTDIRDAMRRYYNESDRYIEEMQSHDEAYFAGFLDFVQSHVADTVGSEGTLLEVGCGGGAATSALAVRLNGFECVGVDISAPAIASAEARFKANNLAYRVGDCLTLPFPDASFSVVVARDVIEHVPDVERALSEAARVLRPGGIVIIKSPHHRSPVFPVVDFVLLRCNYPFTRSWLDNLPRFAELSVDFVRKLLSDQIVFRYRTPDLSDTVRVGHDADAVYEVSIIDLVKFFRKRGFVIKNIAATYNTGMASRLYTTMLPYFASVGLVAQMGTPRHFAPCNEE